MQKKLFFLVLASISFVYGSDELVKEEMQIALPEEGNSALQLGIEKYKKKDYPAAEAFFLKALEKINEKKGHQVATIYNHLGVVYLAQDRVEEAKKILKKGLHIRLNIFGKDHPEVAASYHNLGLVLLAEPNEEMPNQAEFFFKKAKAIWIKNEEDYPLELAHVHFNLFFLIKVKGKMKNSYFYIKKAVEFYEKALPVGDPQLGIAYLEKVISSTWQKKYQEAQEALKKALAIFEQQPTSSAVELALLYEKQADLFFFTKQYKKALFAYDKTIKFLLNHKAIQDYMERIERIRKKEQWAKEKILEAF